MNLMSSRQNPCASLATECSAAEVIGAMRIEPRSLPGAIRVMSAESATGDFQPINDQGRGASRVFSTFSPY
jgi:hypothetical protein